MIETHSNYTDSPPLGRNPLLSSARLLFWLFFHPSAWRNFIIRENPGLEPDFCLAQLGRQHWLKLRFLRLLALSGLAWMVLTAVLITLILRLLHVPGQMALSSVLVGVGVGLVASAAMAVVGSLAVGTAVGLAVGVVVGVAGNYLLGAATPLFSQTAGQSPELVTSAVIGFASGLAGGLAYGVAAGVSGRASGMGDVYSLPRQISGVILGLLIGVAAGGLTALASGYILIGLTVGVPFGLAVHWRTRMWWRGVMGGILLGMAGSMLAGLVELGATGGILVFIGMSALMTSLFALPYVLAERIAGPGAGALAGVLGSGGGFFLFLSSMEYIGPVFAFTLIGVLLGLVLAWWRPVVAYPFLAAWNNLLFWLDERRAAQRRPSPLFHLHSAFWDEFQRLPLSGLDDHLLLALRHWPEDGRRALAYLSVGRQRWAAQSAQIRQDAALLAGCAAVNQIGAIHQQISAGELAGPASALLRSFNRISQDVDAARRQESAYNQRLALNAVEDRLDGLIRELTRSAEPYAAHFQPIAAAWRQAVAAESHHLAEESELRQEIDSPYIIGVPLTERQEIFVGRSAISQHIEQLLLDRRQPPLLLYGQRRVGKTSLLNNLGRLLPSAIIPLFVDLQGPASRATDHAGLLYNMARSMIRAAERQRRLALPPLARADLTADPFTVFEEWLEQVEDSLGENLALLMLDEFEALDSALAKGRFDEEMVMGMLRHLIQHRARFKVLLSGSHTLDEFQRWSGYLINVQVVHIGYLQPDEARQLIVSPAKDFALRYETAARERVLALTRGHPFLVQLLCAEIVALKNEQPPRVRRLARLQDVETAVPEALQHGSFFFADIEQNQMSEVGRETLRLMGRYDEGAVVPRQALVEYVPSLMALEAALTALQHRELIEMRDGGYRFQVPLVQRWFAARP